MAGKVSEVRGAQFDEQVLKGNRPVVVDFYAPWCGPCQAMAPVLEEIAGAFEGDIDVAKVNVDKEPSLAERFGVLSIPTLVFFAGGEEIHRTTGALPRRPFAELVRRLLAAPQSRV